MSSIDEQFLLLLKTVLPEEIFKYFEITQVKVNDASIVVPVDELNLPSMEYKAFKLISKGFTPGVVIQDFPIRIRAVYLHLKFMLEIFLIHHKYQLIPNLEARMLYEL